MLLTVRCNKCRRQIKFSERVSDRIQLVRKKSEFINIRCKNCGQLDEYHVDDIRAEQSKIPMILAAIILIAGTPLIGYALWLGIGLENRPVSVGMFSILLVPILIYLTITKSQREKIWAFNRHKVR